MKNQLSSLLALFLAIFALSSCNQEKCMKEYIECRDACYDQADAVRAQWVAARDNCQTEFDNALLACFELQNDDAFMACYKNANAALKECISEVDRAYEEGMAEVAACNEVCKAKFAECSK